MSWQLEIEVLMSKVKTPETLVDADLDEVQGAGTAVGNPGEVAKRQVASVAKKIKTDRTKLTGSGIEVSI